MHSAMAQVVDYLPESVTGSDASHAGYRSVGEHIGNASNENPKGEELIGDPNMIRRKML